MEIITFFIGFIIVLALISALLSDLALTSALLSDEEEEEV
jgi:hypothetical protein